MKRKILFILLIVLIGILLNDNIVVVKADQLTDNINEQINNIDLSALEQYFNSLNNLPNNNDFFSHINNMINGKFDVNFNNIFNYIVNCFFSNVNQSLPKFLIIIAIAIFCGIMQKLKSTFLSDGVSELILFVCLLSIILLLTSEIIGIYQYAKNVIENIMKLTEIMSPIILSLMIASGGNVSASVYKPTVAFLINIIMNIFLYIILPLVAIMIIFNVINVFSTSTKFDKFSDVISSIIKWIIGLTVTIFTIFLSIQGITSATFDGISLKATKFAISSSIPIVGGFIKDSFDLLIAGSIIIKNIVGITCVFALFYTIISPILYIISFSIMLKLVCAIIEPITDNKISSFCSSLSKCLNYISATIITIGLLLFITILLITISASSFI